MTDEGVTMTWQSYPLTVQWVPGPPTVTVVGYPPLPGENYIDYGRRVQIALMVEAQKQRETDYARRWRWWSKWLR